MTNQMERRSFLKNCTATFGLISFMPGLAKNLNNRLQQFSNELGSIKDEETVWR